MSGPSFYAVEKFVDPGGARMAFLGVMTTREEVQALVDAHFGADRNLGTAMMLDLLLFHGRRWWPARWWTVRSCNPST